VVRELTKYGLDLVGVQEVRWDKGCSVIIEREQDFLYTREQYQQIGEWGLLVIG
jgi:hypothetical protein